MYIQSLRQFRITLTEGGKVPNIWTLDGCGDNKERIRRVVCTIVTQPPVRSRGNNAIRAFIRSQPNIAIRLPRARRNRSVVPNCVRMARLRSPLHYPSTLKRPLKVLHPVNPSSAFALQFAPTSCVATAISERTLCRHLTGVVRPVTPVNIALTAGSSFDDA